MKQRLERTARDASRQTRSRARVAVDYVRRFPEFLSWWPGDTSLDVFQRAGLVHWCSSLKLFAPEGLGTAARCPSLLRSCLLQRRLLASRETSVICSLCLGSSSAVLSCLASPFQRTAHDVDGFVLDSDWRGVANHDPELLSSCYVCRPDKRPIDDPGVGLEDIPNVERDHGGDVQRERG